MPLGFIAAPTNRVAGGVARTYEGPAKQGKQAGTDGAARKEPCSSVDPCSSPLVQVIDTRLNMQLPLPGPAALLEAPLVMNGAEWPSQPKTQAQNHCVWGLPKTTTHPMPSRVTLRGSAT